MNRLKIGESERELLMYFARNPRTTVRDASDYFAANRGWRRTTVMKTVERLIVKELVTRENESGIYRHSSVLSEAEIQKRLIDNLFSGALCGSLRPFVAYLGGRATVTSEELEDLRALVQKLEEQQSEP